jgi:hypothetical protein
MKSAVLLMLLASAASLSAQTPSESASPAAEAPKLTEAQVNSVLERGLKFLVYEDLSS